MCTTPRMSARIRPDRGYSRARVPILGRDNADLLHERHAAHRARVHHRPCRRARPLPRLHGDDVLFLTGTDEHRLKIQRAAEARGVSPREQTDLTKHALSGTRGPSLDISNDNFIRTTEDRHRAAVQALLQRIHDNGFIQLAKYEGLYCVACEAYYTEDELVDGLCPIHHRPIQRGPSEDNYFFQLSIRTAAAQLLRSPPRACPARGQAQRGARLHQAGAARFSMSRTSISWGIPLPWDHSTSPTPDSTH